MVAPTTGKLKTLIDNLATQLETIDNLVVYKYPESYPRRFPCAIIQDSLTRSHMFNPSSPEAVYFIQVTIFVKQRKDADAFAELEKYISNDSPSSMKSILNNVIVAGITNVELQYTRRREPYSVHNARLWGCEFTIKALHT